MQNISGRTVRAVLNYCVTICLKHCHLHRANFCQWVKVCCLTAQTIQVITKRILASSDVCMFDWAGCFSEHPALRYQSMGTGVIAGDLILTL